MLKFHILSVQFFTTFNVLILENAHSFPWINFSPLLAFSFSVPSVSCLIISSYFTGSLFSMISLRVKSRWHWKLPKQFSLKIWSSSAFCMLCLNPPSKLQVFTSLLWWWRWYLFSFKYILKCGQLYSSVLFASRIAWHIPRVLFCSPSGHLDPGLWSCITVGWRNDSSRFMNLIHWLTLAISS